MDNNEERKKWSQLFTYRLIKLLEWFKGIGMCIKFNLYSDAYHFVNDCNIDQKYQSDITIGIDYFDQCIQNIFSFKLLAICSTKPNGYAISLRTAGLFSNQCTLEIYNINNSINNLNEYRQWKNQLDKLYDEIEKEKIDIQIEMDRFLLQNIDNEKIEKDGKIYSKKTTFIRRSENGFDAYTTYATEKYDNMKNEIDNICNSIQLRLDKLLFADIIHKSIIY
jgi:hypothetical protein